MDTERSPGPDLQPDPSPATPTGWSPPAESTGSQPAAPRRGSRLLSIAVGAVTILLVMSLLYGPDNTLAAAGLLVVCTAGIGLIPIILGSWLVGWVVLAIWAQVTALANPDKPSAAGGSSGG